MTDVIESVATEAPPIHSTEHTFTLSDGTELFYRAWQADDPAGKSLILFHRGHEHSGRFQDVVEALRLEGFSIFAWDARGHGLSPGDRGYAPSFMQIVRDIDSFVRHVSQFHHKPLDQMVVLGHSVGAMSLAAWVHDFAPRIRGMVLVTPALRVKLYVPLAIPGLRLLRWLRGHRKSYVKSYVKASMLTHDAEQARRYDDDPLIARSIAVNILLGLHDHASRLLADAAAIHVPTLLLAAGKSDWVVRLDAQQRFFENLGSSQKRLRVFDGMYHDILHEQEREPVLTEVRQFITNLFDSRVAPPDCRDADRSGHTYDEYLRLNRPPASLLQRANFGVQRAALRAGGKLSNGIALGWQVGFDSGQSLDYVYENRPRGRFGIGKWIDRLYLDSVGWRGIRQRKIHLQRQLREAVCRLKAGRQSVRIVDIAAGPGRYLLETLRDLDDDNVSALVRDCKPGNLEEASRLAAKLGLANVAFEQGDAFDEASLGAIRPVPNLVIVSGLYELFPDNDPLRRSLRGLAAAMREGGYLIYTGQPWHPQLEMIARVLPNREGQPWIMRRRAQAELDNLVAAAGFEKIDMLIDDDAIFTVSLAKIGDVP